MARSIAKLLLLAIFAISSPARSHRVDLTWADLINPSGTTYNVYRASSLCDGSLGFSLRVAALTDKAYSDSAVVSGNYCYYVTAVYGGIESSASNTAQAIVPGNAKKGATIVTGGAAVSVSPSGATGKATLKGPTVKVK